MATTINIFGTKFAYPKGLRKSPGVNSFNSCVASKLAGQKGGGRAEVKQRFREAARSCKGQ